MLVNKLSFVRHIHQVKRTLHDLAAKLQILFGATYREQCEHGLSKAVHINWIHTVIVVTSGAVFGKKSLYIVGIAYANTFIEFAGFRCIPNEA
ncbi:hypothetical protein D3C81_1641460 [compost metagenome]